MDYTENELDCGQKMSLLLSSSVAGNYLDFKTCHQRLTWSQWRPLKPMSRKINMNGIVFSSCQISNKIKYVIVFFFEAKYTKMYAISLSHKLWSQDKKELYHATLTWFWTLEIPNVLRHRGYKKPQIRFWYVTILKNFRAPRWTHYWWTSMVHEVWHT